MKNRITLLITLLISISTFAQQGINYKAVVKDTNGDLIAGQIIDVKFSIIKDTGATVVYLEDHPNIMTDANGIIILNIGEGDTTDDFSAIDWGSDTHSLKTEIDLEDDGTFENLGTTPFKAVPYALKSSDNYWKKNGGVVHNTTENIGIGSDTLSAKLGILHNSTIDNPHIFLRQDGIDYARIHFGNTSNDVGTKWSIDGFIDNADDGKFDRLNFWNDHLNNYVMTLTGDGEVGIGVGISPKVDLHVGYQRRVLFGTDTIGPGDKLMWLPDLHAFRVGRLDHGASSPYWDRDSIGVNSFASGHNTRAQGLGATAMGRDTEAKNDYAFASGFFSDAYGVYSTAMGFSTDAFGKASTALGYFTEATGNYSTSMGYYTTAPSFAETVVGAYNTDYTLDTTNGQGNNNWNPTDRLFVIGNGANSGAKNNALTVLKNGNATFDAEIQTTATGDAHMVPVAYGTVESNGNVFSGTGNFTTSANAGVILIEVTNQDLSADNSSSSIVPYSSAFRTSSVLHSNNKLAVRIFDVSGTLTPTTFQFVIYKL